MNLRQGYYPSGKQWFSQKKQLPIGSLMSLFWSQSSTELKYKAQRVHAIVIVLTAVLCGACSTVDLKQNHPVSYFDENTQQTELGQLATKLSVNKKGDQSGFYPLVKGVEALALRLALAEVAEKSIDLQYYLIKNDLTGKMLMHALLQAADRGVRVRILLDDIFTQGYDAGMLALESHPNIHIRLFNPFANRKYRGLDFHRMAQVNRRLHNKSFTVDNQFTIVGGRNIATEYFAAHNSMNFHDVDVLSVGPLVGDVSTMFDQFWNSGPAVPVAAVASADGKDLRLELQRMHQHLAQNWEDAKNSEYGLAVLEDVESFSSHIEQKFFWAPYSLVYDAPEKGLKNEAKNAANIVSALEEAITEAEHSLLVVSPYFVPLKEGIKSLQSLHDRGVAVTIITNSFRANNHSIVHAGYAPYPKLGTFYGCL
jgi:putative cardiolipin synthase